MMRFDGKTCLVTGAGSGIGRAVAEALATAGAAKLVLVDRDPIDLALDCEMVRATGDVSDEALWDRIDLAGLDHAVINAGVAGAGAIAELDFTEWRRILSVNLDGAFLTMRAAMRSIGDGGTIVAVASAAGVKAEPGVSAYGASKAGVIQLAKVAAKEGAPRRIRVNAMAPAGVKTPVWDAVPMFADRAKEIGRDQAFDELAAMATPLGRYAEAEEIARQILFLLSEDSALITGTVLVSDGGYTL